MSRFGWGLLLCVAIGLGLRLWLVAASGWRMDYDEGMVGLLALRVMRGEWMAYLPAQTTLGAQEAYLLAPMFALSGANPFTFRLYGLLTAAAYIVTTAYLGRAVFRSNRAGLMAGLLAAVAPPYMLITSLKTWGSTVETIIAGNLLLITLDQVLCAADHVIQRRRMMQLGAVAGLMFWMSWLGLYYFIPVGLVLFWCRGNTLFTTRQGWQSLAWALAVFLIVSLPFWLHNIAYGFPILSETTTGGGSTPDELRAVWQDFTQNVLPRLLTADGSWGRVGEWWQTFITGVYVLGLGGILLRVLHTIRQRRRTATPHAAALQAALLIFIVVVPLVYVFSGYSRNALNPWDIDATGRYVVMLHSAFPVGLAGLVAVRTRWMRGVALALIGAVLALNLAGFAALNPQKAFDSPYYDRLPASLDGLIAALDAWDVTHVWTDAGIAHVLMFVTHERILAADYYDVEIAGGLSRFPDAFEAVMQAEQTAYVVPVLNGQTTPPIVQAFDRANIAYQSLMVDGLLVILPERTVHPAEVAAGLGYQY